MSAANLSVLVGKNFVCVKIAGRANFAAGLDFKTLLNELTQKGYRHVILDLTDCVLMDSTFLGVLAGFGLKQKARNAPGERGFVLHNASARVSELLENLGTASLFQTSTGTLQLPDDASLHTPESLNPTHEQITRTSLEAHQTLMAMNPENAVRFKDVAQFLAEDLNNIGKAS